MSLEEIKAELRSLSEKLEGQEEMSEEEISEVEAKVKELEETRKSLIEAGEKRNATLEMVKNNIAEVETIETAEERKEEKKMEVNERSVYFKRLLGRELNEEERALSSSSSAVIPTETAEKIFRDLSKSFKCEYDDG